MTDNRVATTRRPIALTFAFALFVFALLACGSQAPAADSCHENSDCSSGLVCALGACRTQCATSADCTSGWSCEAMACIPPSSGVTWEGGASTSSPEASAGQGAAIVGDHDAGGTLCCIVSAAGCAPASPCDGLIGDKVASFDCPVASGPLAGIRECGPPQWTYVGGPCFDIANASCTGTIGACPSTCAWPPGRMFTCPE